MAGPYYVDSNAGGTNAGTSWTDAWTSFYSVPTLAAGEIVYVASNHNEGGGSADRTITGPTSGAPAFIYSCTSGTTTYAAGAVVDNLGGAYRITFSGSLSIFGVTFESGASDYISLSPTSDGQLYFYGCTLKPAAAQAIWADNTVILENTNIDLVNDTVGASNPIVSVNNFCSLTILGGSLLNAGNRDGGNSKLFNSNGGWLNALVIGMDLSSMDTVCEIYGNLLGGTSKLIGCKMPSSFTLHGAHSDSDDIPGAGVTLYSCTLSGTPEADRLDYAHDDKTGLITDDQTIYLSGGATADDGNGGTQTFSYKMESSAQCNEQYPLCSEWVYAWCDSTGAKNLDIYVGAAEALDNAEVYAEFAYLGTSSSDTLTYVNTRRATPLTTATGYTSGGTWSGGGAPANSYYMRANDGTGDVTINEKGYVMARVCVSAASKTIWMDPRIVIS